MSTQKCNLWVAYTVCAYKKLNVKALLLFYKGNQLCRFEITVKAHKTLKTHLNSEAIDQP